MNANLFRLVFNKRLGMYVPVHEATRYSGKASGRAAALSATLAMLLATLAQARSPVPPTPATALPVQGAIPATVSVVTAGTVANPVMNVTQSTATAKLNWNSFNIGSAATVNFGHTDNAAFRVLNRIGGAEPSRIFGQLNAPANGQVFLYNPNGVLFGNGAQVNVGGLVASALSISDDQFELGLPVSAGQQAGFSWTGDATGFAGGFVAVDPGARITTPDGGRVVLLAPKSVENLGHIQAGNGGEAILAAGGSVLLTAPEDPNLRGLLVEVKNWQGVDALGNSVTLSGTVTNKTSDTRLADDGTPDPNTGADADSGKIDAPDGVVSLAALAVNQQGMVKAAKAINLNGQIMLVAGETEANRVTVTQTANQATIDWRSGFSVAQGGTVEFVQPSAGAVAYNFVYDPDRTAADGAPLDTLAAGRSRIDGTLEANGQLFLINELGIDFGSQAKVSAGNFIASALGLNPDILSGSLLTQSDPTAPAFALRWTDPDASETQAVLDAFRLATVQVEGGAAITTAENGYAILAGAQVIQGGEISTPGGQTVLAAGAKLYLKPPYSQRLRGFTAEVDPLFVTTGTATAEILSRGLDANRVTNSGTIRAPFGDITLVGHEILQAGQLLSSTSITRNGSIHLVARDYIFRQQTSLNPLATKREIVDGAVASEEADSLSKTAESFVFGGQGGTLTLAAGSNTEVLLDPSDGRAAGQEQPTLTSDQSFLASSIEAVAANVHVQGQAAGVLGAMLVAKGGDVRIKAASQFDASTALSVDELVVAPSALPSADTGIYIGDGARIDVSGAQASKSVTDLFIEVELRGDELSGNPVQRDGALRGETAWVDIRDEVEIADLSGYFGKVAQTLEERVATGGNIALSSAGSVIVMGGAELDVSGGRVDYASGVVSESKAVSTAGQAYRLNDAPVDIGYAGLFTVSRLAESYTEGKSAGSVTLIGHSLALDGTLKGGTVRGERQRNLGDPVSDRYAIPLGAKLIVKDAGQHYQPIGNADADKAAAYGQAQITFVAGQAKAAENLSFGDSAKEQLQLSLSLIEEGFTRFDITSEGRIEIPTGLRLSLSPGGEFNLKGRQIHVAGDVTVPGGTIGLSTYAPNLGNALYPEEAEYYNLLIDGALSTAGRWVNDLLDVTPGQQAVKALHGGDITLDSIHDIAITSGASLDVSGGAILKANGGVQAGDAGSIKLSTGNYGLLDKQQAWDSGLFLEGTLSGYALGKGGSLEISTSQILFGAQPANTPVFTIDTSRAERLLAAGTEPGSLRVGALTLDGSFLDQGGFFDFSFTGHDGLTVGDNLLPNPVSWTLLGVKGYQTQATGASISQFARALSLHADLRTAPTSVKLSTKSVPYGNLTVGQGAHIGVDPLGSIELSAWRQITVLGTLEARAGSIRLLRPVSTDDNASDGFEYTDALQSRSIYLGAESRLLANGVTKLDANTRILLEAGLGADYLRGQGLYRGEVLGGGEVELYAGQGYLISREGSLIDVSGIADSLSVVSTNIPGAYHTTLVGGAGGLVSMSGREGMFLDGGYKAAGSNGAAGGVFSLRFADALNKDNAWNLTSQELLGKERIAAPRQLTLYQTPEGAGHTALWPALDETAYLLEQVNLDPQINNGVAELDLALLASPAAGFGSLYLQSQHETGFAGVIDASVSNQLRLDSRYFVARSDLADVTLTAAAIQIGNYGSQLNGDALPQPTGTGAALFQANARDLGLVGNFAWSGFGTTTFESSGELHLDSMAYALGPDTYFAGGLRATGTVNLNAGRVIPSTYSHFTVDLTGDPGAILNIGLPSSVETLGSALAVAGRVEFLAPTITHDGRVEAPLGQVVFSAPGGQVTLTGNSVTSVAANEALPLGVTTTSGRLWQFVVSQWDPRGGTIADSIISVTPPEKVVRIDAANSTIMDGATLDLSGGGDAIAWEFSPGPTGKVDVLAWDGIQDPNTFAILPGWQGQFAPADAQNQAGYNVSSLTQGGSTSYSAIPSLKPGDQIELADNLTGLSGRFTLLPASYALLSPDAVLVTIKPTQDSVTVVSTRQSDGTVLAAGTRLAANADGGYSTYGQQPLSLELAPRSVVLQRAEYVETTATSFFYDEAGVQLPGDAGRLSVAGRDTLAFDPNLIGQRLDAILAADGRQRAALGVELDLAAPNIEVTDGGTTSAGTGWTTFDKDKLNELGVFSLLLGGLRTVEDGKTRIETISNQVRVATSGGDTATDALQAPEILLTANDNVTVEAGSLLGANGEAPAREIELGRYVTLSGGAFQYDAITGGGTVDINGHIGQLDANTFIHDGTVTDPFGNSVTADLVRLDQGDFLNGGNSFYVRDTSGNFVQVDSRAFVRGATGEYVLSSNSTVVQVNNLGQLEVLVAGSNTSRVVTDGVPFALAADIASARSGDGAFLRLAGGEQASLTRNGIVTREVGDLRVLENALLTGQSQLFDATHDNILAGTTQFQNIGQSTAEGGALTIGAGRINVVGDASIPADGLTLDNAHIAGFGALDQLRLTSYTTVDLYGPATLGAANVKELVVNAAGLAGHGAATDAAILRAESVRFENSNPESAVFDTAALGAGILTVEAETVTFGGNATTAMREAGSTGFAMRGFDDVNIQASDEIRFTGTGVIRVDNDGALGGSGNLAGLTLDAGRVVAATGSDQLIQASGAGKVTGGGNAAASEDFGGMLDMRGDSLDISGRVLAQAGRIALTAMSGNVSVGGNAVISAEGIAVSFSETWAYAPAGTISITSDQGDVEIGTGTRVSVSGAAEGGDAGRLLLSAQTGEVKVGANTLFGSATGDGRQGELVVDAGTVSVDELSAAVGTETVSGVTDAEFQGSWDIRRREGDIDLSKTVKARRVRFAADAGDIHIQNQGVIDASDAKGGKIELYANRAGIGASARGGHVYLLAGGLIQANATYVAAAGEGTAGRGGTVLVGVSASDATEELNTGISFEAAKDGKPAAIIDVSTATDSLAEGGEVVFSAPRQDVMDAPASLLVDWSNLIAANATGNGTAYSIASGSTYASGLVVAFKAPAINTNNPVNSQNITLRVGGQQAKPLLMADGGLLEPGTIQKDSIVVAVYDGTAFRVTSIFMEDTGFANTYKVTPLNQPDTSTALRDGYTVSFRAKSATTSSGAANATLEISSVGTDGKTVKIVKPLDDTAGADLISTSIKANQILTAAYDAQADEFRLVPTPLAILPGAVSDSTLAPVSLAGTVDGAASIVLEGVRATRVAGDYKLDAVHQIGLMAAARGAANLKGADFLSMAGGLPNLVFRPGEEVRTSGSITVSESWNLSSVRANGQPGTLILRAGDNLYLDATISDGFVGNRISPSAAFGPTDDNADIASGGLSWTYRFTAGADMTSADPLATLKGFGDILVGYNNLVRTGTGHIGLAAGGDVALSSGAAVYTAGVDDPSDPAGYTDPNPAFSTNNLWKVELAFPTGSGDLEVTAGGDIFMPQGTSSIADWLYRYYDNSDTGKNTHWMPRIPSFYEGLAVFGGGDIHLEAGGDIDNLIAVIPTSGRVPIVEGLARADLAVINGGGDLSVTAAGSINGGIFYAENGQLDIIAARDITGGVQIALGNTAASARAGGSADIGAIQNPLFISPDYKDSTGATPSSGALSNTGALEYKARFFSYGERSRVSLLAVTGDMTVSSVGQRDYAPSQVSIASLLGDVEAEVYQAPGLNGQLDILAQGNIALAGLYQYDIDPSLLPSIANPLPNLGTGDNNPLLLSAGLFKHAATFWHQDDTTPSRLIANSGNIGVPDNLLPPTLVFNEPIQVEAAGDISDLGWVAQHTDEDEVSRIVAGGKLLLPTVDSNSFPSGSEQAIILNGPGRLEVLAGAGVDLGNSLGIVTRGNLENAFLPEGGASVFILAGAQADYDSFRQYLGVGDEVSDAALRDRFYTLLRDKGREALEGGGRASYEEGRAAIAALFPAASITGGDIEFFSSQIKTEQGGGIDLLAPGGGVTVGIANPDSNLEKGAGELGLFTVRGGGIRALVRDDFLVNQSRVFTLYGGDILIWSDQGDIDAGSGAKTVSATPPPVLVIRNGQIVLDTSNSVSGSGIGALASRADTPPSDLDLFAPEGAIDAGDAGLRSTGNVFLGATVILNSANIQVGGSVSGVPISTGGLVGLSGVGSSTESAASADAVNKSISENAAKDDKTAQAMKQALASFKPTFITVEVLGFGEGGTSAIVDPEEEERRKRANSGS